MNELQTKQLHHNVNRSLNLKPLIEPVKRIFATVPAPIQARPFDLADTENQEQS